MAVVMRFFAALVLIAGTAAAGAYILGYFGQAEQASRGRVAAAPPVIVADVKRRELVDQIEAIGTTFANESVTLTAPVTELISAVEFTDGQRVRRGDVLVRLSTEVQQASLLSARATLDEAEKQLVRIERLARQGTAAETRLDEQTRIRDTASAEVERIEAEIARRVIRAPFDGVIGLRRVSEGALVQPGTELATIQDISVLKLDFTVPELYLTNLRSAQEITARTPVFGDETYRGEIATIESRVDPVSRAVTVRALIPNGDGQLKPGMLMSVSIVRERADVVMVPEQSIIALGPRAFVYRLEPDNKVRQVEVKMGRREPGYVEILSGLTEGEVIVVEGTIRVKDGMTVNPQRQNGPGADARLTSVMRRSG
jgi:membrane fusion protein (multidrug efflux system)